MLRIDKNGLDVIKSLIVDLDVEACGFLIPSGDELTVYIDSYGTTENGRGTRGTCQHRKYTAYIWHSHSSNLIAYPSPEDILKIIKKRPSENPQVSVIFSKWGIWSLYSERKVSLDENWIRYFIEKINQDSKILYERTGKGRGQPEMDAIKNFIDSVKEVINKKVNVGLEIQFQGWN